MPPPGTLRLLVAVGAALATLLVAGVAALVHYATARDPSPGGWRLRVLRLSAATPWRGRDLAVFLLVLAAVRGVSLLHPFDPFVETALFHGAGLAILLVLASRKTRPFGPPLSPSSILIHALLRWLAILPILWFSAFAGQLLLRATGHLPAFQDAIHLFLDSPTRLAKVGFILFAMVIAPFTEETLFRGILFPLLVRRAGSVPGLLITAIAFAALHASLDVFVPLAVLSVALSLAYARTKCLWVPMAMHALFNATNLVLLLALSRTGVV